MSTRAERQWLQEERRKDRQAADAFLRVCLEDRADELYAATRMLHDRSVNGWRWWMPERRHEAWRVAMREVAQLPKVSAEIQKAFIQVWAGTERLPETVRDRHLMAKVLRLFMPGDYRGQPLTLFRGAEMYEWRDRSFGFSWSTNVDHARKFAYGNVFKDEYLVVAGVLLRTVAPPEAVLLVRPPDDFSFDVEDEVVVDPYRLGEVTLVVSDMGIPKIGNAPWGRNSIAMKPVFRAVDWSSVELSRFPTK